MKIKLDPLDKLFSRYIRLRVGSQCEYCGRTNGVVHCAHNVGRRYRMTRWESDNAACLCYACHNLMHDFASIKKEFFVKLVGSDRVEQLEILARSGRKPDKEAIKASLLEKIKLLEGEAE